MPDGETIKEYIGMLMIHSSYPSQNNQWILRFYDKYICHSTSDWYSGAKISYVSNVKRKIFYENKKKILSDCKRSIKGTNENICYYKKEKSELVKRKRIVEKWEYKEYSTNG